MELTHIVTNTGFECDIAPSVLDDAELLDLLLEIDTGNVMAYGTLSNKLIDKDTKKALYDHCRTLDGRVPWDALSAELGDIIKGLGSKKK